MLDNEELALLNEYEAGEWTDADAAKAQEEITLAKKAAKAYLDKTRAISIRLSQRDLEALRNKAREVGIPYQSLIGSLVHQYAEGKIKIGA